MAYKDIRIQDDLYKFVNQEWIDNAVIPSDRPTAGGFSDLDRGVEELMINEFNSLSTNLDLIEDENMKKAVKLFSIVKNVKKRNKEGIKPLLKTLKKIEKITSIKALNKKLAEFAIDGLPLPFKIDVDANMKDTLHNAVIIIGPSVILPDTQYYKEEMKPQHDMLINLWSNMAKSLLAFTSLDQENIDKFINDTLAFDKSLATLVKSSEEWSEYTKMYNPAKTSKTASMLKPLAFKKMLTELFGDIPEEIIIGEPRFFKAFKTVFNEDTFEMYKHWAYVMTVIAEAKLLSEELRELSSTYSRALTGVQELPSIEKQAYGIASSVFSEPIGIYYGRKYFGEEAKSDVVEMVHEIIDTYKERVARNDFLKEETKAKAIVKLDKIVVKMGYPDKSEEVYDLLNYNENGSLYDAISEMNAIKRKYSFSKLYKDVDRTQWVMPGHMVNACYNPFTNDITFPAAILQAPFYSIKQSRSQNLGGIGAVIGHEISHAFDNNGAQCDENGNLNNWWTKEDFKMFKQKTKAMIKQFDGIELEWGKVNGAFVVSENIADNGGMAVTLEIMKNMKDANYEEYFHNWARVWCMKAKTEFLQLILQIDVHSPNVLRANMQPRNFVEWYDTFNVKKTDKMYIAPAKRIIIW